MDYREFAKQVKTKYPSYQDIDDYALAQKVIEKYPVYKEQVSFDTNAPTMPLNTQEMTQKQTIPGFMGNIAKDVYGIGSGLVQAASNPLETAKNVAGNVYGVSQGIYESVIPGRQGNEYKAEEALQSLNPQRIAQAAYEKPVSTFLNVASLGGAGKGLTTLAKAGTPATKMAKIGQPLTKPIPQAVDKGTVLELRRAIRPGNLKDRFNADLKSAMPEIKQTAILENMPLNSLEDMVNVIGKAKERVYANVTQAMGKGKEITVEGSQIAEKLFNNIDDYTMRTEPQRAAQILEKAATYDRQFTLGELDNALKAINKRLDAHYKKSNLGQQRDVFDPGIDTLLVERKAISEIIDSKVGTGQYKKLWGSLRNVEEATRKRLNTYQNAAPLNLAEQLGIQEAATQSAMGAVGGGVFGGIPGAVAGAAIPATRVIASKLIKKANSPDNLVRKSFQKVNIAPKSRIGFDGKPIWLSAFQAQQLNK